MINKNPFNYQKTHQFFQFHKDHEKMFISLLIHLNIKSHKKKEIIFF